MILHLPNAPMWFGFSSVALVKRKLTQGESNTTSEPIFQIKNITGESTF